MAFETGLFLLRTDFLFPEGTAAWAECAVDLMDQPIVRFHYVCADGYGKPSYSWYDDLWLRVDRMSGRLQLVIEVDGEWSVEFENDIDEELEDELTGLRGPDVDDDAAEHLLSVLLRATGGVTVEGLDQATVDRLDGLPFGPLHKVAAERDRRGLWNVTGLPGSG